VIAAPPVCASPRSVSSQTGMLSLQKGIKPPQTEILKYQNISNYSLKLLFTQDALVNAGAERSHLDILSRFSKEMDIGFVYFYPKHDLKEDYERAGIRLFFLDIPESYHFPLAIFRLVKLIRQEKPDLLVSSLWRADIITRIASLITGVPLVGTLVNDSYGLMAWTDKHGLKYKLVYWLDRLTARIPIHWIANAQALVDSHVKTLGLDKDKISVVYRGRVVPVIARTGGTKQSLTKSQFPNSEIASAANNPEEKSNKQDSSLAMTRHFISYGRLLERKGFQDAIQAFSEVLKPYPNCTLTIFGEGPYRKELEKLIQSLGLQESVFLPGKIPNPIDVLLTGYFPKSNVTLSGVEGQMTTAHCFLFPSWYEGFSGALVEAMMAGIPIIASDIPMNLEAVEADKSALIFPVGNSKALEEKMIYAIEHPDLMLELRNQAKIVAIQRFDIEVIARQYEEVLKGILPKVCASPSDRRVPTDYLKL
jgi:glycosyltransferase involved in cell wall biosynthesis